MRSNEESRIQQACVRWINYAHPDLRGVFFAVPNGGARNVTTGALLKAEGVTKGVADLILLKPTKLYHGLCIEMKTARGKQSPEQRIFQEQVQKQGYCYVLCRSVDEFMKQVDYYLTNT